MVVSGPAGEIRLSGLRGRVAIVHFWATWCESCRGELPQLQGLLEGLSDQQAVLRSVSIETDKAQPAVEAYARALGYQGEVAVALPGETPAQYWTWGVPVTYFISRKGTILWRVLGQRDWRGEAGKALLQALLHDPR
jgi:thiol-disulfide isomerase/thioredoxin